jgi:hypothetical protein
MKFYFKRTTGTLPTIALISAACIIFSVDARAGWLNDYQGTLGNQKIGMEIKFPNVSSDPGDELVDIHYFYDRYLKNIHLRVIDHQDRHFTLEEVDSSGKPVARFHLEFPEFDNFHHYSHIGPGLAKLSTDEVVGTWDALDGNQSLPVQLFLDHAVTGGGGGQCDVEAAQYQHIEDRAKLFREEAIKGDKQGLKRDFHYLMPPDDSFRKYIAAAIPHDLFCPKGIFLLGSGWVGFDENGNVN